METKRKVSQNAVDLIVSFEGEILKVYLDPIGLPTVGVGHLCQPHEGFRLGEIITRERSRELLRIDIERFEKAINELVLRQLNQNQFDAVVSFAFNVGTTTFRRSSVLRLLNESRFADAANFLLRYRFADGKSLKGLLRRRKAERQLFLS